MSSELPVKPDSSVVSQISRTVFGDRSPTGGIVAIGNFDGVHRGHRSMLERLRETAGSVGTHAVVVTFDPHPLTVLRPEIQVTTLTTIPHRVELLRATGVEVVVVLKTTPELLALNPRDFFERVLCTDLRIQGIVEGPNFRFGKGREGDISLLRTLCSERGLRCDIVDPVLSDSDWVSSSSVRAAVERGDLAGAVDLLGHPYRMSGQVVTGARRGRTLGFPTANLANVATLIPSPGVYAGWVRLDDSSYRSAINIGPNPTFGEGQAKIEVHLLEFHGDLYGRTLEVDLESRIRDVRTFASLEQLREQIAADIKIAVALLPIS